MHSTEQSIVLKFNSVINRLHIKNYLREPYLWVVFVLITIISLFYYLVQINWLTVIDEFPWIRSLILLEWSLKTNGSLYFIPLIATSILFSWRGALTTWLICLIIIFPYLSHSSPTPSILVNNIIFLSVPIFIIISLSFEIKWRKLVKETATAREKERHDYLSQIFKAQEDERERISREIHDDSLQELSVTSSYLQNLIIDDRLNAFTDIKIKIISIRDRIEAISKNLRDLCIDIRPAIINDLGLIHAIRWQVDRFRHDTNINSQVFILGKPTLVIPKKVSINLFRIVQESLNNIKWHADASSVEVIVDLDDNVIKVIIKDNGKGFSLSYDESELIKNRKLGIIDIKKRTQIMNGKITFDTALGKGTSINVEIPLYN